MAMLPPDGTWIIQQIDGEVILFHGHTEQELLRVDPSDADAIANALKVIYEIMELDAEQKCLAHFWLGYFYAYATFRKSWIDGPVQTSGTPN